MCGILAILSHEQPVSSARLIEGSLSLAHRGPDGVSQWIASHRRIGLAQTRLSIVDLSNFAIPIANEDETLRVVVNGEFYGFRTIRKDLERRGHRFRTHCDSEIVLHLYEEFGERCLEHLRGEFAFVLWDEKANRLFAARDRFGIKPLYYAETPDALYVASEAKALFAAGAPAAWDREAVFQNIFLCLDQDRTLYRGVKQVPPGHWLTGTQAGLRVRSYWDLDYPRNWRQEPVRSESGVIEEIQHRLKDSVQLRLQSDVPVGCYLSGGLDSSSVLGLAVALSSNAVPAFTVAFDHPDFDESHTARNTAAHLGTPFIAVPVTDSDCADHFADAVCSGEMVHYNGHGAARYLLSRTVRESGYKAVLAGEGADELFAGYDFAQTALEASMNRRGRLVRWFNVLKAVLGPRTPTDRRIAATSPWLTRLCRLVGLPPSMLDSLADKLSTVRDFLAPDFVREFHDCDPYKKFIRRLNPGTTVYGREPVHQLLYVWMKSLFPNYVLGADRLDMAHGIEVRLPFLDHKLFEFVRTIPPSMLLKNGQRKYVLREAMKPFVTTDVYSARKHPFFAPPSGLRPASRLHTLLEDHLRSQSFSAVPFFDPLAVRVLLEKNAGPARATLDPLLFMLASMSILQSRYRL